MTSAVAMIVVSRDDRNTPRHNLDQADERWEEGGRGQAVTYDRTEREKRHPLSIGRPEVLAGASSSSGRLVPESSCVTGVGLVMANGMWFTYRSVETISKSVEEGELFTYLTPCKSVEGERHKRKQCVQSGLG